MEVRRSRVDERGSCCSEPWHRVDGVLAVTDLVVDVQPATRCIPCARIGCDPLSGTNPLALYDRCARFEMHQHVTRPGTSSMRTFHPGESP